MSLLDRLRTAGGRLGIIKVISLNEPPPTASTPQKVVARSVTLDELTKQVRTEEVRVLAGLPAELTVPFEKVFEAAGVTSPGHGWSVDRLSELLRTDQYKGMDRDAAQKAVLGVLSAVKANVEDLIGDAVARDQALDKFEAFVSQKMEDRKVARQRKATQLEDQIRDLEKERARLEADGKVDAERWREWRRRKVAYEHEMAWAMGYLLDRPVVTTEPMPE